MATKEQTIKKLNNEIKRLKKTEKVKTHNTMVLLMKYRENYRSLGGYAIHFDTCEGWNETMVFIGKCTCGLEELIGKDVLLTKP